MKKLKIWCACILGSSVLVAITITTTSCSASKPQLGANDIKGGVFKQGAEESCVLLKNRDDLLPLTRNHRIDLFGVTQINTFYGGGGSGAIYYPYHAVNILDGIRHNPGLRVNDDLANYYEEAVATGNYDNEDSSYICNKEKALPNDDEWWNEKTNSDDVAIVVIGRDGREGRDSSDPSVPNFNHFSLTDDNNKVGEMSEKELICQVSSHVDKTLVLFNTTSIIDMKEFNSTGVFKDIPGLMYCWCGGQETGDGVASVLAGDVSPSGKLVDTITKNGYPDYPSYHHFGDNTTSNHIEDIYVGYRYFETFATDKIMYHFGYGLSYTQFDLQQLGNLIIDNNTIKLKIRVTNTGNCYGKEVVQVYFAPPTSGLNKPDHQLVAYAKTDMLGPNNSQDIDISFDAKQMASYDDSDGVDRWVLEAGSYNIKFGTSAKDEDDADVDVLKLRSAGTYNQSITTYITPSNEILKPVDDLDRAIGYTDHVPDTEIAPKRSRDVAQDVTQHINSLPNNPYTGYHGINLFDVYRGKKTMDQFVAQIQNSDLTDLLMSNWDGQGNVQYPGSSSVMGGVNQNLRDLGIPTIFTIDGPAGTKTFNKCYQAPMGTASACTFNDDLVKSIFQEIGKDMIKNGSPILLGPGLNIHRDPTAGRNFEYFSEDPLLTGMMASNVVEGLQSQGVMAVPKHFAVNSQEHNRYNINERVSERALNEIYLRGFEIVVKEAKPFCIMTSYNQLNTRYNHSNFELITTLLRNTWGFNGCVLTDWGGDYDPDADNSDLFYNAKQSKAHAGIIRAGGNLYQSIDSELKDDQGHVIKPAGWRSAEVLAALNAGELTLSEAQDSAKIILNTVMNSSVFLQTHGLENFGSKYVESIKNIQKPFTSSKSSYQHIDVNKISLGNTILSNLNANDTTYSLINCNYISNNWNKIKVQSKNVNVQMQYDELNDINEKVVTITLTNNSGDLKKYHLYSTLQPDQSALHDEALLSCPSNIYINNQKYLGYFKNRFTYDIYVDDINNINISAQTKNNTNTEKMRNGNQVILKCSNQYQTLSYTFNIHEGSSDIQPLDVNHKDMTILDADNSFYQYGQSKHIDNRGSYIGDTQIDGYSVFSINVKQGGDYSFRPIVASSQSDRTFDQLKSNGEFEVRIGKSLDNGKTLKWRVRAQPTEAFVLLDPQTIHLNKGIQNVFFYTRTYKIIDLQSILISY